MHICSCSIEDTEGAGGETLEPEDFLTASDYGDFTLQDNVVFLSESFADYVEVVDTLTIRIRNSIPEKYIPENGDIIYCMKNDKSPFGFVGKVKDIEKGKDISTYHTETVTLVDIFKELHIDSVIPVPQDINYVIDEDGNKIEITNESSEVWDRICADPHDTTSVSTKVQTSETYGTTIGLGIDSEHFEGKLYVEMGISMNIDISLGKLNDLRYEISQRSGIEGKIKFANENDNDGKIPLLNKAVMLPVALTVGPFVFTMFLKNETGLIAKGEVSLEGGICYEFENCTYSYSYNNGNPVSNTWVQDIEKNKMFLLSKFEAKADFGMYEELALELALYHRDLLALGASAEASFTTSISGEVSFDTKELLSINPSIKIGPALKTGLYCGSKLFKEATGEEERYFMMANHPLGEFEIKVFPEFANIISESINGKLTTAADLIKNNFVRTEEEGFALFRKNGNGTPLEHKKMNISSTKGSSVHGSATFNVSNPDEYTTKAYVVADGKYFYLEDRWVDLGLPSGILWAAYNVGATSPEEYGGYYAWGETEEKDSYTWENYKYYNSSTDEYDFIGKEISGTSYDVAHVKWGDGARMPKIEEAKELIQNCIIKIESINGIKGNRIIGPNNNSIFLPFTGTMIDEIHSSGGYTPAGLYGNGEYGIYWLGTLLDYYDADDGCSIYIDENYIDWDDDWDLSEGMPIRPVKDRPKE